MLHYLSIINPEYSLHSQTIITISEKIVSRVIHLEYTDSLLTVLTM